MVVPTAGAYYLPEGYEKYNASHRDSINSIANKLVNVINVDGYAALEAHTNEYIYTRTDHHWEPLGAYYAAKAFCEMAQVPVKELSTYKTETIEGFVGTMYAFTEYNERIKTTPIPSPTISPLQSTPPPIIPPTSRLTSSSHSSTAYL